MSQGHTTCWSTPPRSAGCGSFLVARYPDAHVNGFADRCGAGSAITVGRVLRGETTRHDAFSGGMVSVPREPTRWAVRPLVSAFGESVRSHDVTQFGQATRTELGGAACGYGHDDDAVSGPVVPQRGP